jgi:glutathione S-transferase
MTKIEYVDVATARSAPGVRLVVSGLVPSPWSEAAKGMFRVAGIAVQVVRRMREADEITAWTGVDNVPVVFHGVEPARSNWAAITTLAARLAGPGVLLPEDAAARAETMGLLHEIAGEDGAGWNARLAMIHATLTSDGKRGFPLPIGKYLAARYGYSPEAVTRMRPRFEGQLQLLRDRLRSHQAVGHSYLGGERLSALDVYSATFLTPLTDLAEPDCPSLPPVLRAAFRTAYEELGGLVPPELLAHRKMMFERHLDWPIEL